MTAESLRLTPADVAKKSYIRSGLLSNVIRSIWVCDLVQNGILGGLSSALGYSQDPSRHQESSSHRQAQLGSDFTFGPSVPTCPYITINIECHIDSLRKLMFFCLTCNICKIVSFAMFWEWAILQLDLLFCRYWSDWFHASCWCCTGKPLNAEIHWIVIHLSRLKTMCTFVPKPQVTWGLDGHKMVSSHYKVVG